MVKPLTEVCDERIPTSVSEHTRDSLCQEGVGRFFGIAGDHVVGIYVPMERSKMHPPGTYSVREPSTK